AARADLGVQVTRGIQERFLVAPHEVDLEQLDLEVASVGRGSQRLREQVGRLVVEAVGDVEIGLGDRVGLIEVDDRLVRQRLVGGSRRRGAEGSGARTTALRAVIAGRTAGARRLLRRPLVDVDAVVRGRDAAHALRGLAYVVVDL